MSSFVMTALAVWGLTALLVTLALCRAAGAGSVS